MTKYDHIWMIQEGMPEQDQIKLHCVCCGKPMSDNDHFWFDWDDGADLYCSTKCTKAGSDFDLSETQRMAFAIQAAKALGFAA